MGNKSTRSCCAFAKVYSQGADVHGLVSLDRVKQIASNPARTTARYHVFPDGRTVEDDYEVSHEKLGAGLCGSVVVAIGRIDRRRFAMKSVKKSSLRRGKLEMLIAEVEIYLALDHPNIARLHDVYETRSHAHFILECCEGGELYARLQRRGIYTDSDAAEAARQMLRAVSYLHAHNVVHRDLKLENFLYGNKSEFAKLKLIDFGFAKIWDPSTLMMASCGSIAYVSPDVLYGKGYGNKCDIWSIGVMVWMLLVGYPPFGGNESQMIQDIKAGRPDNGHPSRWREVDQDATDFLKFLLNKDPSQRPDARDALRHKWLTKERGLKSAPPVTLSQDTLQAMQRYAKASKARRAALQLMAQELDPEEVEDLRDTFIAIDKSEQGTIGFQDLKQAIRNGRVDRRQGVVSSLHDATGSASPRRRPHKLQRASSRELEGLFSVLSAGGNDQIYYSDFLAATMEARSRLREEVVRSTFKRFDADDSGTLDVNDLKAVLGETFEGIDVEELVAEMDQSGAGEVTFEAFVKVLEDRDEVPSPKYVKESAPWGAPLSEET